MIRQNLMAREKAASTWLTKAKYFEAGLRPRRFGVQENGRPPGPSIEVRLTPEEVERLVSSHGYVKRTLSGVGPFNYLITFKKGPERT